MQRRSILATVAAVLCSPVALIMRSAAKPVAADTCTKCGHWIAKGSFVQLADSQDGKATALRCSKCFEPNRMVFVLLTTPDE